MPTTWVEYKDVILYITAMDLQGKVELTVPLLLQGWRLPGHNRLL